MAYELRLNMTNKATIIAIFIASCSQSPSSVHLADDDPCTCSGTGPGSVPVTINCGESACGSDFDVYSCSSDGWTDTHVGCTSGWDGTLPVDMSLPLDLSEPQDMTDVEAGPSDMASIAPATFVLELPPSLVTNVNHAAFWSGSGDIGTGFFWDAWVAPLVTDGYGYLISDGNGGAHALLWGFDGSDPSRFTVIGNVWDGSTATSFGSSIETGWITPGEWAHVAVAWDGNYLVSYIDGIVVGLVPFTGPRQSQSFERILYVGGSDHENLSTRIAWIRGWDTVRPAELAYSYWSFVPDRFPRSEARTSEQEPCDFLADYTIPGPIIPDLSHGYLGTTHPGQLYNYQVGGLNSWNLSMPVTQYSLPQWVVDQKYPLTTAGPPPTQNEYAITPPSTPESAKVFDSFSRRNQTYALQQSPTLGSTESGSLGAKTWHEPSYAAYDGAPKFWGILSGKAVFLGQSNALAWIDNDSADMTVCVDRAIGSYYNAHNYNRKTGIVLRVVDDYNYLYVNIDTTYVTFGEVVAGIQTQIDSVVRDSDDTWITLCAIANGVGVEIKEDGSTIMSETLSQFQTATGAGIGMNAADASNINSLSRWTNFTVY